METVDFLSLDNVTSLVEAHSIILFSVEDSYPLLFFSKLYENFRAYNLFPIVTIDVLEKDVVSVQPQLETTFLGNQSLFWLKSFHELDERKKKSWFTYISLYQGPHKIIISLTENDCARLQSGIIVKIPTHLDIKTFTKLLERFFVKPSQAGLACMARLFKRIPLMNLDAALLLMDYLPVISAGNQDDLDAFLDSLVGSEQSLFMLSTLFFAKQRDPFFALWARMHAQYPEIFWLNFWAEQLWRASYYITYMRDRNPAEAKKIGYRLPFSFMQKDWKLHTSEHLKAAHQYLYSADFALKNGNEVSPLEVFYVTFFQDAF